MDYYFSKSQPNTLKGYLRWKEQLKALNRGDFSTVKKLGKDAKTELEMKRRKTLPLPFN